MTTRKITVLSTKTNGEGRKEVMTDAATWGQLKVAIEAAGLSTADMKATVRSTKNSLDRDDAEIPAGDQVIFLTPAKVKSGVNA